MAITPVIAIHGGAGTIMRSSMSLQKEAEYQAALTDIISAGQSILAKGGSALDAVTEAVRLLEENPLFNAGKGAVFTHEGTIELDASIMDGRDLNAGAVAGVKRVRNPILAARAVMEKSDHVMFIGEGAEKFSAAQGLEIVEPKFYFTQARYDQLQNALRKQQGMLLDHDGADEMAHAVDPIDPKSKYGTVGAVAIDSQGNLAAATSTGGLTNKQVGRVGDSPIIGAGCYANNQTVAVSATGTGEMFIRTVVGHEISSLIAYGNLSLKEAVDRVVYQTLPAINGQGGVIAIDHLGNVSMTFNTEGMYRGVGYVGQQPNVAIYRD